MCKFFCLLAVLLCVSLAQARQSTWVHAGDSRIRIEGRTSPDEADQSAAEKRDSITWAQRLKRIFDIDIATCSECGGNVRIIASIEDPVVIQKILTHLDEKAASVTTGMMPQCRNTTQSV